MLDIILSIVHNASTLLFGVYISAAFLGIRMNRKKHPDPALFFLCSRFNQRSDLRFFGDVFSAQVYPLIIHLPLILFLSFYYKYKVLLSALSVSTAYLCCQISKWVGLVAK